MKAPPRAVSARRSRCITTTCWANSFPQWLRRILDIPAYWLIFLTIEFPAIYPAGLIAFAAILRSKIDASTRNAVLALAALTAASLMTAWLLVSTLASNNDLGWRAVLPAVMVLTAFTAAGLARWIEGRAERCRPPWQWSRWLLGLPDGVLNLARQRARDGRTAPAPRSASKRRSGPASGRMRRRTNASPTIPLAFQDMTPWPVNIAWALLSESPILLRRL